MKIITCFIPATSGEVDVCGFSVDDASIEVRRKVGYLPESNPLYLDMYVKEYLEFVGRLHSISNPNKRVEEMIEMTGLSPERGKLIGSLSKGYKQRVGIAQAVIHDPDVLILDEPTSGLDPNQLVGVRQLIKELGASKTVLFSSHIMQEVEAVSDRVIILDKGKMVANSAASDLSNSIAGTQVVEIEFDKPVKATSINKIEGVSVVKELGSNKFEVHSEFGKDLRPIVAKWANDNDLLVLSMSEKKTRLEDVFQKLTS
jgi:ABC-2 type transport system ATP-binding protein